MQGMSERRYAAHVGLSRGAIQKAKEAGRLVLCRILDFTRALHGLDGYAAMRTAPNTFPTAQLEHERGAVVETAFGNSRWMPCAAPT